MLVNLRQAEDPLPPLCLSSFAQRRTRFRPYVCHPSRSGGPASALLFVILREAEDPLLHPTFHTVCTACHLLAELVAQSPLPTR